MYVTRDEMRAYKWTLDDEGRNQRLIFLAFLLTWHDEITGYSDD